MNKLSYLGTPLTQSSTKIMLLGSGELGKEIAIEAQRLGLEVIAVDRYDNAPAMQVAHRKYVIDMMDYDALYNTVRRENPYLIIPEIEAINTEALKDLEIDGYNVTPNAKAVSITMNRIELRKFASEELGLPTTRYFFTSSPEETEEACEKVGYPCLIKPEMSSSGHGHVLINSQGEVKDKYKLAISHSRGKSNRVIVEEYVKIKTEFTILTYRYVEEGDIKTDTVEPIQHFRYGKFHYIESWQPAYDVNEKVLNDSKEIAIKVARELGGLGIYGMELIYTEDGRLLFSEVAPRSHDTGLVTLVTLNISEFAIHLRSALGLPIPKVKLLSPGASLAVYAEEEIWGPRFSDIYKVLSIPDVDIRIFGKPKTYKGRRMAVILARGATAEEARYKVQEASKFFHITR